MIPSRTQRWQAIADLDWRRWGDETVVYCDRSGDTMLLEPAAAALLTRLRDGPADVDELAAVVPHSDIEPGTIARSEMLDILHRLVESGAVEKVGG